jgi:DNA-binding GntR family transcriptional regulator
MTDSFGRAQLYRRLAAQLRQQIRSGTDPDAPSPFAAFLATARTANRRTLTKGLRALKDALSPEDESPTPGRTRLNDDPRA